jgi:ribosomal protection tetracycline resistance protein
LLPHRTLNLGILAHVDAGKTTLTERLLYAAGVIDKVGSVDAGTTQTDSLALERQRGITIKAAVVSFAIGDVTVNLIDTPGHPDFIAEVERVLSVLDGAVLVLSAVEGVQPQTRVLMRALQRLKVPTLIFVNKIDRAGAGEERVLQAITKRLDISIVPMGSTQRLGGRTARSIRWGPNEAAFRDALVDVLSEHDQGLLTAYVENDAGVPYRRLRRTLAAQSTRGAVHPVFFGSAITGAGVDHLMRAIPELLPSAVGDADAALSAQVFKIDRGAAGERIAYARTFSGTLHERQRVRLGRGREGKVTAISVFDNGADVHRKSTSAGEVSKLWGLDEIQVGDCIGTPGREAAHQFAPPTMETVVAARTPEDQARLVVALAQLAEQDPLINVRRDETGREISICLYGEVQKEVIQATLAEDFGIDVSFRETTTIYIERPVGRGRAVELLLDDYNPFSATLGLRVQPGPVDSGVELRVEVHPRRVPLYIYKTAENFRTAMSQYVALALAEGLHGWQVTDCIVTIDDCGYYIGDGPTKPTRPTMRTTASDFRNLTPMVLMAALEKARTRVCEPMMRVNVEAPPDDLGAVLTAVAQLGGTVGAPSVRGDLSVTETLLPAARAQDLTRQLPELTGGEGVLDMSFAGYRPVAGRPPKRRRSTTNPLQRVQYLMGLRGRGVKRDGADEL